ncbi:hypothetical protein TVAG_319840 [Trichomonas vaginalis G3]|uniref:Uncharacterized protein n=1 Tax=Trichomonas vaginalis (strain ATCC PRA-98 / G3) TaxID=412133 RepID=A2DQD2_TRIV3|nr:protein ubiquitination [Trichomonas vaginalis G3]EAY17389.1 hypothetical protein TVAG_319840 [Trichomonas vaginalis G3]KAI5491400.1 protein ubiquitination [Trichomonas vaginalis G3]|eukprot:XP_001330758.1 hypothetical protein [Trichomonas vaginalis G3]
MTCVTDFDMDMNEIALNLQRYIDNKSLIKKFSLPQICKIISLRSITTDQASYIFDECNFRYDASEIFRIFMAIKVNFGPDTESTLNFLHSMYLSLKAPIVKTISEAFEDMNKKILLLENQLQFKDERIQQLEVQSGNFKSVGSYSTFDSLYHVPSPGISPNNSSSSLKISPLMTTQSYLSGEVDDEPDKSRIPSPNIDALKNLQKIGADFQNIYDILDKSAKENDVAALKYAVKNGYVDVRDGYGSTCMIKASYSNNFELCKILVECGADFNKKSRNGNTVLYFFAKEGNLEAVKYFANIIDVNTPDRFGLTTLHEACYSNRLQIVQYLLSLPTIDINIKDIKGRTPLKISWMEEIRRLLIASGAKE